MENPRYGKEPTTPFLQLLHSHGYTSWHAFDLSRSKAGFWKALALGIVSHSHRRYPSKQMYLDGRWRQTVQPLLAVEDRFSRDQGNDRFANVNYWSELGSKCMSLAIDFYITEGKTDQATTIRNGNLVDFQNKSAYSNFARFMDLFICVYERRAEERAIRHEFSAGNKGTFGLCVNLAMDGDRLYLLYHKDLAAPVRDSFPFLIDDGSPHPIIIDAIVAAAIPQSTVDPWETVSKGLIDIVEAQARVALTVMSEVPKEAMEAMNILKQKVNAVKRIIDATKVNISLDHLALTHLLSLPTSAPAPASAPADPRLPHTVQTCGLYPEDTDYIEFHQHYFHRACLAHHLESLDLHPPAIPQCPIPMCGLPFPETVIELSQFVLQRYEAFRDAVTRRAVTTDNQPNHMAFNGHKTVAVIPSSMLVCVVCERQFHEGWMLTHGCRVCLMCAAETYLNGGGTCRTCGNWYRSDEKASIENYRESYREYYRMK